MNFPSMLRLAPLALSCSLACHKANPSPASTSANTAGEAAQSSTTGDESTCQALTDKLCTEAGKESMTCANAQTTLGLLSDAACAAGLKDFALTQQKLAQRAGKCDELAQKLCADLGPETDTCKMVIVKTPEFPPEQCVAMLAQFDQVLAELKAEEAKNQPLSSAQQEQIAAADAPSFGPTDAKVTIVTFSDFQCPYCARAAEVTQQIQSQYGQQVRFVFRQYPLSFHAQAQSAAEAALAAHKQGKFWEYHDKLFADQSQLDRDSLEQHAQQVGLNLPAFKQALDSKQFESRVKEDVEMGNEVSVQGTPTMFINGKRIANPTDFSVVSAAIESALGS